MAFNVIDLLLVLLVLLNMLSGYRRGLIRGVLRYGPGFPLTSTLRWRLHLLKIGW